MDDVVRGMLARLGDGASVEMAERALSFVRPLPLAEKPELAGQVEIAEHLGCTRQQVASWLNDEDIETPDPIAVLRCGRIWDLRDWRAWSPPGTANAV